MLMLSSDVWLRCVAACRSVQRRALSTRAAAAGCFEVKKVAQTSRHAAGQEAADRNPERAFDRPDHRPTGTVRLRDNGIIGDHDPFALEADAVMTILGFPVRIRDGKTVCVRATKSLAALERIEPWFQRGQGVAAVVTRRRIAGQSSGRKYHRQRAFGKTHATRPATEVFNQRYKP